MLGEVERVEILYSSAHKLQLANCAQLRDHQPLYMRIHYELWYQERCDEKNKNHIDMGKMMRVWETGNRLREYRDAVEQWVQEEMSREQWQQARERDDVDEMEGLLTKGLAEVAGKLFPKEEVRGKYGISEETKALFT